MLIHNLEYKTKERRLRVEQEEVVLYQPRLWSRACHMTNLPSNLPSDALVRCPDAQMPRCPDT